MAAKVPKHTEGHQARKRFGQNFLHDPHVIDNIVSSIAPQIHDKMVEIGPGLGALTGQILSQVNELQVIELDRDLIPRLMAKFGNAGTTSHSADTPTRKLNIHQADALKFDYSSLVDSPENQSSSKQKLRIVGNLPYNISTPLIFKLLENSLEHNQ